LVFEFDDGTQGVYCIACRSLAGASHLLQSVVYEVKSSEITADLREEEKEDE
jgi:hypothetical protein